MMTKRGIAVDHSTIHRRAIMMLPVLPAVRRRRKRPVGRTWPMDETYITVAGQWKVLYRAVDKSGSNKAAIVSIQVDRGLAIVMRQSKYLNNIVEQDHRAIKRVTRPMLGFKTFRCARIIIAGIEIMHRIRKTQLTDTKDRTSCAANQFYSLAF